MELKFLKMNLKVIDNDKGIYGFAELKDYIDFDVKRVYFIQNCKQSTGQHCHKEEKEMFIMVKGNCTAIIDKGDGKEDILLNSPGDAIYIGSYIWHGFKDFSSDAILLALSSTNYREDRSDYVENYDEYQKLIAA
ncbi:MAG: fatty-acid oxidation protein subunit alpha [Candidatus Magasanikbacteria bacterium CG10_big_fil_rev_8_21_14_0_10_36_32]|uniref:Fatty-acid oxidation protein subunit alpha n=1 Tax=Candidatus Magasanikbacteria bacterium CG10_big_fil_rev_8_21_14_0_10_36_32 TaxID=1974646 RepID=A0A2M6W5I7_9BACT|nr:MAG: fatty-acid oxidation protein subunit alpha [Candidatus Magasanikbacteria bacterium CG10_big_fil_rev_8_21_14_0_10_36_32]